MGLDVRYTIAQLLSFAILFFILRRYLFPPLMRILDERSERINTSLRQAEEIQQQLARTQADYQEKMEEARRESQSIITQATQMGEKLKDDIVANARRDAENVLTRARAEITSERERAVAELRGQVADLALLAAGQVIGRSVDDTTNRRMVDDFIAQSRDVA
jgi:F-type H+-transporting ATPase subunit b